MSTFVVIAVAVDTVDDDVAAISTEIHGIVSAPTNPNDD